MIDFFVRVWRSNWRNKAMLIAGALIFVTAIVGVIYAIIVRPGDLSFMERDGHQLKWQKSDLPLSCFYLEETPEAYLSATQRAIATIHSKTGLKLFGPCVTWQIQPPKYAPDGGMLLSLREESDTPHGAETNHRYEKATGRIRSAWVRFDKDLKELAYKVALHELGHVLGLDHDRERSSIMYPTGIDRPNDLSSRDVKFLQEAYGNAQP